MTNSNQSNKLFSYAKDVLRNITDNVKHQFTASYSQKWAQWWAEMDLFVCGMCFHRNKRVVEIDEYPCPAQPTRNAAVLSTQFKLFLQGVQHLMALMVPIGHFLILENCLMNI